MEMGGREQMDRDSGFVLPFKKNLLGCSARNLASA